MTKTELDRWLDETAWDKPYWSDVRIVAEALNADGCSGIPDTFVWSCLEHDVFYRTHRFINGGAVTKKIADYCLRVRIQQTQMSLLKWPISWIRWLGVAVLFSGVSQKAWDALDGTTIGK